jgi:O-antigen ligase
MLISNTKFNTFWIVFAFLLLLLGVGALITRFDPVFLLILFAVALLFTFFLFPTGRLWGIYLLCLTWWIVLPFGMGPLAFALRGSTIPELLIYLLAAAVIVEKVISSRKDIHKGSLYLWAGTFLMLLGGVISWFASTNTTRFLNSESLLAFRWSAWLPCAAMLVFLSQRMTSRQIITCLLLFALSLSLMVGFAYLNSFQLGEFNRLGFVRYALAPTSVGMRTLSMHPVPFGSILVILSPMFLALALKLLSTFYRLAFAFFFMVTVAGILLSGTRGAFISLALGVLLVLLVSTEHRLARDFPRILFLLLGVSIVGSVVFNSIRSAYEWGEVYRRIQSLFSASMLSSDPSIIQRNYLYAFAFQLWGSSPLLGVGFGTFISLTGTYEHATYLTEVLGAGLIGLFGYLFLLYRILVLCWHGKSSPSSFIRTISNGALVSVIIIIVVGLTDMIFMTNFLATGTLVFLGLVCQLTFMTGSSVPSDNLDL